MRRAGRHFLQIPGSSAVPNRILRAIDKPVIDHRGPGFAEVGLKALKGLRLILRTSGQVVIYPPLAQERLRLLWSPRPIRATGC